MTNKVSIRFPDNTVVKGWNNGVLEYCSDYTGRLYIQYVSGAADQIRIGFGRGQLFINKGDARHIAGILDPGCYTIQDFQIYFPKTGKYKLRFYVDTYVSTPTLGVLEISVTSGERPLDILDVTIPWTQPVEEGYKAYIYVSFNKLAPKGTKLKLRIITRYKPVDSTGYKETSKTYDVVLQKDSYFYNIIYIVRSKTLAEVWVKACASLDGNEWKCSNEVNLGVFITKTCIDPFSIPPDTPVEIISVKKEKGHYLIRAAIPKSEYEWAICTYSELDLIKPVSEDYGIITPLGASIISKIKEHMGYNTISFDATSEIVIKDREIIDKPDDWITSNVKTVLEEKINEALSRSGINGSVSIRKVEIKERDNTHVTVKVYYDLVVDIAPVVIVIIVIAVAVASVFVASYLAQTFIAISVSEYYKALEKYYEFCTNNPEQCRDVPPPEKPEDVYKEVINNVQQITPGGQTIEILKYAAIGAVAIGGTAIIYKLVKKR